MSSKQDESYEKKIAEQTALGENANDMGLVINVKRPPIQFLNETWEEIVMWCKRLELGEHVSLVNDRLFCISYSFMHVEKEHQMSKLSIYGGDKHWMSINWKYTVSKEEVPKLEVPENIIAGNLTILHIDNAVLQFIRLLAPIYSAFNVILSIPKEEELCKPEVKELIRLLFYQTDGLKPKIVGVWHWKIVIRKFVEIIKEDFLNANQKASFVVKFSEASSYFNHNGLSCNIVNSATEERLTIHTGIHAGFYRCGIIARLPQDCPVSPEGIYEIIHDSAHPLPNVQIDL